jgi:hypothetical protein
MTEPDVERRLAAAVAPDREAAEERAWRVVSAAFDERLPMRRRPGTSRRSALALAAALVLGVLALSPVGAAVASWVRDAFDPGRDDADPALVSLPAAGRLLVTSGQGPWIVHRDGSKRRLGAYEDAAWSPRGLFVAVTAGRELVAVEPDGDPRWSLARSEGVSRPAWSPDGFRIAYLSGRALRVVAGDGTGDARLAERVAAAVPAWRPGAGTCSPTPTPTGGSPSRTPTAGAVSGAPLRDRGRRRWPGRPTGAGCWRCRADPCESSNVGASCRERSPRPPAPASRRSLSTPVATAWRSSTTSPPSGAARRCR